jgi:protocatechuate 3,4-dioxygenase beta subunit
MTKLPKVSIVFFASLAAISCNSQPKADDRKVGDRCDGCEMMYENMPASLSWETTIENAADPGEPMVIEGTIFKKDGKTPAPGAILYLYHTDAKGYYSNPKTKGNRHGHLRGWIKTGADGKYKFTSIRPAPYPGDRIPAHIHPLVKEPGMTLYWIDEYLFEDDSLVTNEIRKNEKKRGGNGIIPLTKADGVWRGKRDIVLGMNIPNY